VKSAVEKSFIFTSSNGQTSRCQKTQDHCWSSFRKSGGSAEHSPNHHQSSFIAGKCHSEDSNSPVVAQLNLLYHLWFSELCRVLANIKLFGS